MGVILANAASRAVYRAEKMGKADLVRTERIFAGLNCFEPGQRHELHSHPGQDKLYVILEGRGQVTVGDESRQVGPGDLVLAEAEEPHALEAGAERLVALVVMAPPPRR